MEDYSGAVQVAHGNKDTAKTGHFRRTVGFVGEKCHSGVMWLDDVPGTENWADMCTKAMHSPGEFHKLCGVVMGETPDLYLSPSVKEMLRTGKTTRESNGLLQEVADWLDEDES